jgi:hypothetical protein
MIAHASSTGIARDVWIFLRTGGETRRFLKVMVGSDGSVYLALGDPRRNVQIASGSLTIPEGETSASVDISEFVSETLTDIAGQHIGYKSSGRVIAKYGERHRRLPADVPPELERQRATPRNHLSSAIE